MLHLKIEDFEKKLAEGGKTMVVDFWAPWCRYCKAIEPAYDALAADQGGQLTFAKVNIDEAQALAERYQVMTIPTFLLFKNGEAGARLIAPGSREALENWLKEQNAL